MSGRHGDIPAYVGHDGTTYKKTFDKDHMTEDFKGYERLCDEIKDDSGIDKVAVVDAYNWGGKGEGTKNQALKLKTYIYAETAKGYDVVLSWCYSIFALFEHPRLDLSTLPFKTHKVTGVPDMPADYAQEQERLIKLPISTLQSSFTLQGDELPGLGFGQPAVGVGGKKP